MTRMRIHPSLSVAPPPAAITRTTSRLLVQASADEVSVSTISHGGRFGCFVLCFKVQRTVKKKLPNYESK